MKLLVVSVISLVASGAIASTTTISGPAAGTTAATIEPKKSVFDDIAVRFATFNDASQATLQGDSNAFLSENYVRLTKKLDDKSSLRLLTGFQIYRSNNEDAKTDAMDTYIQYARSGIAQIGEQSLDFAIRPYIATSERSREQGLILPQARIYLSTTFQISDNFSLTPYLNPRFYVGDNTYRDTTKRHSRMYYLVGANYTFSDAVSLMVMPMIIDTWSHNTSGSTTVYGHESILTTKINKNLSIDLSTYNIAANKLTKSTQAYWLQLNYDL